MRNLRTGRRSLRLLLVASVVLAIAAGVAYATTTADSPTVYTACKLNATGTIRLIDPSLGGTSLRGRCTSFETQISWNQTGPKGAAGAPGAAGVPGAPGAAGAQGLKGDKGDTGGVGLTGAAGSKGDAGTPGTDGQDGVDGLNGSNGADGAPGAAGAAGAQGLKGDKGDRGDAGTPGTDGQDGVDGLNGSDGANGAPGAAGAAGPAGPATDSIMGTIEVPECQTAQVGGCMFVASAQGRSTALDVTGSGNVAGVAHLFAISTPAVATTGSLLAATASSAPGAGKELTLSVFIPPNGLGTVCRMSGTATTCTGFAPDSFPLAAGSRVVAAVFTPAGHPASSIAFGWRLG